MSRTPPTVDALRVCSLVLLLAQLSACGGRSEQAIVETPQSGVSTAHAAPDKSLQVASSTRNSERVSAEAPAAKTVQRGVLLAGLPSDSAYSALHAYVESNQPATAASSVATTLTQGAPLKVTLDLGATVGQVNTALGAVGARIVSMRPGHQMLTIELPAVGHASLSAQKAASSLLSSRAFQAVQGTGVATTAPEGLTADPAFSEPFDHDGPSS